MKYVPHGQKSRMIAFLAHVYKPNTVGKMCGVTRSTVNKYVHRHKEIYEYAKMARAAVLIELAQRKAVELLETFDPEQVPHEKRAQSVKWLMDAADTAGLFGMRNEKLDKSTVTRELIYRVTERMMDKKVVNIEGGRIDGEAKEVGEGYGESGEENGTVGSGGRAELVEHVGVAEEAGTEEAGSAEADSGSEGGGIEKGQLVEDIGGGQQREGAGGAGDRGAGDREGGEAEESLNRALRVVAERASK